jgi:DNA-binding protein H-NS
MSESDAGKGSDPRPVVKKVYDKNYEYITWSPTKKLNEKHTDDG